MTIQDLQKELTDNGIKFSLSAMSGKTLTAQKQFVLTLHRENCPIECVFGEYEAEKAREFVQNLSNR